MQADASLDRLLKSLDLEKYSINFQAEEACLIYVAISNRGYATAFVDVYSIFRLI